MRTQSVLALLLVLASLVVLPGCRMNERLSGTAIGGVAGAGIGALAGGWTGALIGGATGALAGYLVGDYRGDQCERGRSSVFGDGCGGCAPAPTPCGQAPACAPAPQCYAQAPQPQAQQPPTYAAESNYGYPSMVAGLKVSAAQTAYERGRSAKTAAEAKQYYTESLRLDPAQPAVHNALGLHDLIEGNRANAEQRFRTALRYDPSDYAARHNLRRMGIAGF